MRSKPQWLSGWGRYPRQYCQTVRPEKYADLHSSRPPCVARGQGRSYGDAALNDQRTVILTGRLNRLLAFDPKQGILTAEAGVTLAEILDVIVPAGWFLPVTPGTRMVSLGGCVAADVHGKNHHQAGSWGNYVLSLELITASGEILICAPHEHKEIFWATVGGMGLTGLIGSVTVQLQRLPSRVMRVQQRCYTTLAEIFHVLVQPEFDDIYSVAWLDASGKKTLGRGVLFTAHHASATEIPSGLIPPALTSLKHLPLSLLACGLNRWSIDWFNALYFTRHQRAATEQWLDYTRYFYPLDGIAQWSRLYGKAGFVQLQCVFPHETALSASEQLLRFIQQNRAAVFLGVLKRMGAASHGLLSFPKPGFTLALDMPFRGADTLTLLQYCHDLIADAGGRVYLAKDVALTLGQFRAMYPRYGEWLEIKQALDPQNVFQSSLSRRLGIGY